MKKNKRIKACNVSIEDTAEVKGLSGREFVREALDIMVKPVDKKKIIDLRDRTDLTLEELNKIMENPEEYINKEDLNG